VGTKLKPAHRGLSAESCAWGLRPHRSDQASELIEARSETAAEIANRPARERGRMPNLQSFSGWSTPVAQASRRSSETGDSGASIRLNEQTWSHQHTNVIKRSAKGGLEEGVQ